MINTRSASFFGSLTEASSLISRSTSFLVTPSADAPALAGDDGALEDENIATERTKALKRLFVLSLRSNRIPEQLSAHLHDRCSKLEAWLNEMN